MGGATVFQVIPADRGDDNIAKVPLFNCLRNPVWLIRVKRGWSSAAHITKFAHPGAQTSHNHNAGSSRFPTL